MWQMKLLVGKNEPTEAPFAVIRLHWSAEATQQMVFFLDF